MSPDAYEIAERRIRIDVADAAREFQHSLMQIQEEMSGRGVGTSSIMIHASFNLSRKELELRAFRAWDICRRLLDADDAAPSTETRDAVISLVDSALSSSNDIVESYSRHTGRMSGNWPTLDDARDRALKLAISEIDIDFLRRKRNRLPIGDVLRAPRYETILNHWTRAKSASAADQPDIPTALKEGVLALEALAKLLAKGATVGDCVKDLRARGALDPGADKILEGIWILSNAAPGVRHAGETSSDLTPRDWNVYGPMIDGALTVLLEIDR